MELLRLRPFALAQADDPFAAYEPTAEEDAWVWLSEQWWTPWAILIVSMVMGLWMIRSLTLHRGRDRQIARAAEASGMRFQDQDGPGLGRIRFRHFLGGDGQGWSASNLVTYSGTNGHVHAFDARSWTEFDVIENPNGERQLRRRRDSRSVSARTIRRHSGRTSSGAVARLPINAPQTLIARENLASKLFAAATRLDLDVESGLFNRSYHVISDDRRFAQALLDARMIDLMVNTEGRISFEFFGRYLLLHTVQVEPELLPGLARLADQMSQVVPQLVIDRYPAGQHLGA